ncbi:3'(2'),5'-bisphosphate nucleotidase CysQ [Aquibacillus salsiterrae]|uniref:3'(2'),5'-bisphosphate nucleotidase CysQ n=1 Tax=Aquibacillus salsiterrae TaxID=2950439 RepID=A0A9X4ADT4_9BACI|nr:3'(2'),5'-bisphosphate nucleotidase CysQ [Aquibacillus salsiterrae]MDC3415841.1 3'(2'),5'-bisphosphate nucleotidase CysQ [Aquibacillus salsiterrae]
MGKGYFFDLYSIALAAGKEIMSVYKDDFAVEVKADDSPITVADNRANRVILDGLKRLNPDIPVLSEEGNETSFDERKSWQKFWLVDPLDGTKEFIKKNDEFTVNIALIESNYPTLGIIYAPALDVVYFGAEGVGAFKLEHASTAFIQDNEDLLRKSVRLSGIGSKDVTRIVASRSHMSKETEAFIEEIKAKYGQVEAVSSGSSLKFCLVAEGKADFYPRYAPTMEWDTGAGQAIVEAAGGKVSRYEDGARFFYNREDLRNGWFLVENNH